MKPAHITLDHGSGGRATAELIERIFVAQFAGLGLQAGHDFASVAVPEGRQLVVTTDSYVVSPRFFPGGDIGSLAIHGTVNDLAVSGGQPLYLTVSFILEEGLAMAELERIVASMAAAARQAGVAIVTGDTKVVERGKADGLYINTTGIGRQCAHGRLGPQQLRPGDAIVLSGTLGDHGVSILCAREQLHFEHPIVSDSAPLHGLVAELIDAGGDGIRCLRDLTRGGLAAALNELTLQAGVAMHLMEARIPVQEPVQAACELLGLDPLAIANEGKLVAFCDPAVVARVVAALRRHPYGAQAAVIGEVLTGPAGEVTLTTSLGGQRLVAWPHGQLLPRIC